MKKHGTKICFIALVIYPMLSSVSLALSPDIFLINLPNYISFTPGSAAIGDTLSVNWKISANAMVGIPEIPPPPQFPPAQGPWDDGVFLSKNTTWDSGDILIGSKRFTGTLYAGGQYSAAGQFQIPSGLAAGSYHVIVFADYSNLLNENDETNNYCAASGTLTIVPEPATLLLVGLGGILLRSRKF